MSAAVYSVPYLMTQSDYEHFVTGYKHLITGKHPPEIPAVDFAVDEPLLAIERDGFWVIPEEDK